MKILEFLFHLLFKFIKFPEGRYTELKDKAQNWWNERKAKGDKTAALMAKSEGWGVQVGLAILFIISVKYIGSWLFEADAPKLGDDDEEDLYDDEEEKGLTRKARLS